MAKIEPMKKKSEMNIEPVADQSIKISRTTTIKSKKTIKL